MLTLSMKDFANMSELYSITEKSEKAFIHICLKEGEMNAQEAKWLSYTRRLGGTQEEIKMPGSGMASGHFLFNFQILELATKIHF